MKRDAEHAFWMGKGRVWRDEEYRYKLLEAYTKPNLHQAKLTPS